MLHIKDDKVIEEARKDVESCPVCDNRMGFAFGTCVSCGFNYISANFEFIKVHVDHLPKDIRDALIKYHASKYNVKSISYENYYDEFDYYERKLKNK